MSSNNNNDNIRKTDHFKEDVSKIGGLAASIRATAEKNATFDLAGCDAAAAASAINDAFSRPFALPRGAAMMRITLIVGGGKGSSRSRYDGEAMRSVTSALRRCEYVEDRGASAVAECAGRYKVQHDTGKNIFTVIVFPKIVDPKDSSEVANISGDRAITHGKTNTDHRHLLASSSAPSFRDILSTHCPTYSEKRACLQYLETMIQRVKSIEAKMIHGQPLDSAEQAWYDSTRDLDEKLAYAREEASKHVAEGRITLEEKNVVVEMNRKRIDALMNEGEKSPAAETRLKKALARRQQLQALDDDALSRNSACPPPLRYESQIFELRKKLLPLHELEESSKGRLLTVDEAKLLAEKEGLEKEAERLRNESRGWFEEEDAFLERSTRSRERMELELVRWKKEEGAKPTPKASAREKSGGSAENANTIPLTANLAGRGLKKAKAAKDETTEPHPAAANTVTPPTMNESSNNSSNSTANSLTAATIDAPSSTSDAQMTTGNSAEPDQLAENPCIDLPVFNDDVPPPLPTANIDLEMDDGESVLKGDSQRNRRIDLSGGSDDDADDAVPPLPIAHLDSKLYDEELGLKDSNRVIELDVRESVPPLPDSSITIQHEDSGTLKKSSTISERQATNEVSEGRINSKVSSLEEERPSATPTREPRSARIQRFLHLPTRPATSQANLSRTNQSAAPHTNTGSQNRAPPTEDETSRPSLPILEATLVEDEQPGEIVDAIPIDDDGPRNQRKRQRYLVIGLVLVIGALVTFIGVTFSRSSNDGSVEESPAVEDVPPGPSDDTSLSSPIESPESNGPSKMPSFRPLTTPPTVEFTTAPERQKEKICNDFTKLETHLNRDFEAMMGRSYTTSYKCSCSNMPDDGFKVGCSHEYFDSPSGESYINFEQMVFAYNQNELYELIQTSWSDTSYGPIGVPQEVFNYEGGNLESCTVNSCMSCVICDDIESVAIDCGEGIGDLEYNPNRECGEHYSGSFANTFDFESLLGQSVTPPPTIVNDSSPEGSPNTVTSPVAPQSVMPISDSPTKQPTANPASESPSKTPTAEPSSGSPTVKQTGSPYPVPDASALASALEQLGPTPAETTPADMLAWQMEAATSGVTIGGLANGLASLTSENPSSKPTAEPSSGGPTTKQTASPHPVPVTLTSTMAPQSEMPVSDSPTKQPTANPASENPSKTPTAEPSSGSPTMKQTVSPYPVPDASAPEQLSPALAAMSGVQMEAAMFNITMSDLENGLAGLTDGMKEPPGNGRGK